MIPAHTVSHNELTSFEISQAWNLPPIAATQVPSTGTIHQITLLQTCTNDSYVLRAYRYTQKDRPRILCEHALSSFVHTHGLPAIAPLPLLSGETVLERDGRFYALYPFAKGEQFPRSQVTSPEIIAAMGQCLGKLHQVLSTFPPDGVRPLSFSVDPEATFSKITCIEAAIGEKADVDPFDASTVEALRQRRQYLQTAQAVDLTPFRLLQQQVLHGDYQESNLFFADGTVSAIIDWDQASVAPRSWEIVRTLHYVFDLDERSQTFLKAYREVVPLSCEELALTVSAYGWIQANNLWAYTSYYLKHNQRVRHLLQPHFRPIEWATVGGVLQ